MASLSVGHASLFSTVQTRRMSKSKHPVLGSSLATNSSSFSRKLSSLRTSNNIITRIVCMSKTASDDTKPICVQPNENKVVEVSSWIDYLPKEVKPFAELARMDKSIGTWLFIFPVAWSSTLAASMGNLSDFKTLAVYACAAPFLNSATSIINDFVDRDLDKLVERTKTRPLVTGAVTPFQGLCYFAFQMLLSHVILLQLPRDSTTYEAAFIFLSYTYPLMKRITYWPQAYLGMLMNCGAFLGWYAVTGSLQPSIVFPLFLSCCFWTIVYDTIYAHQDKEDDIKVGIKSTALKFGDSTKEWLTGFAIACIATLALTGYNAALGWPFYVGLAAASGHLTWQIGTVNLSSPTDCFGKFSSNKWFGALVFSGILLGKMFP